MDRQIAPSSLNAERTYARGNPRLRHVSGNWHALSSVGTGVQNRDETNQLSYYLALQLTF
jgi:hypothetical protein